MVYEEALAMFSPGQAKGDVLNDNQQSLSSDVPRTHISGKVAMCEVDLDRASKQSWEEQIKKQREVRRRVGVYSER